MDRVVGKDLGGVGREENIMMKIYCMKLSIIDENSLKNKEVK